MKGSALFPFLSLLSPAVAAKVYLAGDSTMAKGGGGSGTGTEGWGVYFPGWVDLEVVNNAIGGRSWRSFTVEGRFDAIINKVVPGDFCVMEFGHNDGGGLDPDNGRACCGGTGSETCTTKEGRVVQTCVTYATNAAKSLIAKGCNVIISSPTPNNICESGTCSYGPSRFTDYARISARNAGSKAVFVDHGQYMANRYISLGANTVNGYYRSTDHTHTLPAGAKVAAESFAKAVSCAGGPLAGHITSNAAGSCV